MILTLMDLKAIAIYVCGSGYVPPAKLADYCGAYYQPYYGFMHTLSGVLSPIIAVELGVETGRGAMALSLGNHNKVYGIDHTKRTELDMVMEMCPNFTFVHKDSMPVPTEIPDGIEILHVDTEHSFAMASEEFRVYRPKMAEQCVVLFDDLHAQEDGVLAFFSSLDYPRFQMDELHPITGYGVLLYDNRS